MFSKFPILFYRKGDETYNLHNHKFIDNNFDQNDEETMKAWGYQGRHLFGIKIDLESLRTGGVGMSKAIETMQPKRKLGRCLGGENTRLVWWQGRIIRLIRFCIFQVRPLWRSSYGITLRNRSIIDGFICYLTNPSSMYFLVVILFSSFSQRKTPKRLSEDDDFRVKVTETSNHSTYILMPRMRWSQSY